MRARRHELSGSNHNQHKGSGRLRRLAAVGTIAASAFGAGMFMGESSPAESGSQDSYSVSAQATETEKTAEADSGTLELSPEELEAVNQTAKETVRETVKKFEESNADRYRNGYGQITYYLKKPEGGSEQIWLRYLKGDDGNAYINLETYVSSLNDSKAYVPATPKSELSKQQQEEERAAIESYTALLFRTGEKFEDAWDGTYSKEKALSLLDEESTTLTHASQGESRGYEHVDYGVSVTGNSVEAFTSIYTTKPDGATYENQKKEYTVQSQEQTRKILDTVVESSYLIDYNNKDKHSGKTK